MEAQSLNDTLEVIQQVWGKPGEELALLVPLHALLFWSPLSIIPWSHYCLCHSQAKLSISWFPSLLSVTCFRLPVLFFFFFWLIHRSARSHRLFLKGQWKVTEQSKSHVSRPTLIVRRGLHCYSKTTRLEVSKGEQNLRLNLLNICFSHLWWLLVQLWA